MMKQCLVYVLLFYLVFPVACPVGATGQKTSVFNDSPAPTRQKLDENSLVKEWFTHPVLTGAGMFSPVYLPFDYLCLDGEGDPNQSLTFPSLLSFKFDFVPDNSSMNHPMNVFRRDPDCLSLQTDDAQGIAAYIRYWNATHALGGRVIETKRGYKGSLIVFDHTGREIWQKEYTKPMAYFTLMGQMVKDWMAFRGQPVSRGLAAELTRPMTSRPETVRWFGEIFHVDQYSPEEWEVYEKILHRDPDFAEVQFWYANQRGWQMEDECWAQTGRAKALLGHLVVCVLREFVPAYCPDQALLDNYEKSLEYAAKIMPGDPRVEYSRLYYYGDSLSLQEVASYAEQAGKSSFYDPLLTELAFQFRVRGAPDKSIPLYISALNSGYFQSVGHFDTELKQIGYALWTIGYWEEAIAAHTFAYANCEEEELPWFFYYTALNFRELFANGSAAELFLQRYIRHSDMWSLLFAYMSLFEGGQTATIRESEENPITKPTDEITPFYQARKAMALGKTEEALSWLEKYRFRDGRIEPWLQAEVEIIRADALLLAGEEKDAIRPVLNAWYLFPRSRRTAFLVEQAFSGDHLHLTRFAKTAAFIFPQQTYWQSMLARVRKGKDADEKTAKISRELKRLRQEEAAIPGEGKIDFWLEQFPFNLEYLCLETVKGADPAERQEALAFYLKYARTMREVSEFQAVHTRVFFIQLVRLLPPAEQDRWLAELDRAWEGFRLE